MLQYEAILAANALTSAHWYASQQRQGKALDSLQKASLYCFAVKDPIVSQRIQELCRATYLAWKELDFSPPDFYFKGNWR